VTLENFRSRFGRWFNTDELARAYHLTFRNPTSARYVLPDIAEFCRASEPAPKESDLFVQGRASGRRDVWLHINEYLHLSPEELADILRGQAILIAQERP
jgi:hypothetical protein